jgi:hypothetical protein
MSDWSLLGDSNQYAAVGALAASSAYTSTTAHASANTKGVWVEAIAATLIRGSLIIQPGRSGVGDLLADIAVGAAGSEQTILSNLLFSTPTVNSFRQMWTLFLPIDIPIGSRLAIRSQATTAASTATLPLYIVAGGFGVCPSLSKIDTYGADEADSGGTSIDPGGTVNTKGAYSELSASCNAMKMMFLAIGSKLNATYLTSGWLVDIAVGAAESEQIIFPDIYLGSCSSINIFPRYIGPFPVNIPAGTRIAIRAQCATNDASDRLFDAVVYGMR